MTDNQLIISSGDVRIKQFDIIFGELQPRLHAFAWRIVSNEETSKDIVNDCFAKYWQVGYQLEDINKAKALLFTMVRNACIAHMKRRLLYIKIKKELLLQPYFEEQAIIESDIIDRLNQAVDNLPQQCQEVVKLLCFKKLKNEEVATILNISPNTVKNHYIAAKKLLRKAIGERELMIILLLISLYYEQKN